VLRDLGYVEGADDAVTLKGRAACEINSTQDELVATEAVFRGLLAGLTPEEAVALMSALVFQEKSDVEPTLPPALAAARADLEALVEDLTDAQAARGLPIAANEYKRLVLHPGLMEVVYEWARGTPFSDITSLTDVMEGSIVRAVVRLDQCCRELMDAARVVGDTALFRKMAAASAAIKRDVCFAPSLYTSAA
jgi:antiviral helicase SKI2